MGRQRSIEAAQRIEKAVALRAVGRSYEQIARACGYRDRAVAYNAVKRELARRVSENVDELRALQQVTLNKLWQVLWPLVFEGKKPNLGAVDRMLKLMDQEARLYGLYPPASKHQAQSGANCVVIVREGEATYEKWLKDQQAR